MISLRFVCNISICFAIFSNVSFAAAIATAADMVKVNTDVASNSIDEQLYSRQIFVYGKSAQQSLSSSHVLVRGSNGPLAAEIIKNLALAGVGRLSIMKEFSSKDSSISTPNGMLSGDESLVDYVRSLNPLVVVDELFTASEAPPLFTVAVCAENKMETLRALAAEYRSLGIKHIGCNVLGVCGYVCDDFMEGFEVLDSDGEVTREVILKSNHQCDILK
jgi:ubiquitin-activating enzyme E1